MFCFALPVFENEIPVQLLWNIRTNMRQKSASPFSPFMLIIMVFSVIRVEIPLRLPREDEVFSFLLYATRHRVDWRRMSAENLPFYLVKSSAKPSRSFPLTLAILIACIVPYRSLFTQESRARSSKKQYGANPLKTKERSNERSPPYTKMISVYQQGG